MSTSIQPTRSSQAPPAPPEPRPGRRLPQLFANGFAADRLSGIYIAVMLAVVFSVWNPDTFATANNVRVIAASEAITGVLTLGLMVSLLSGMFDVSVAANMSLGITLVGWLQAEHHVNALLAVVITLVVGGLVGAVNAIIITQIKVAPVIATLAMSSILAAVTYWIGKGASVVNGISPTFNSFGQKQFFQIPVSVFYLAGLGLILWYLLEHTKTGRYMYAVGANAEAAALVGLKVVRVQTIALVTTGVISSFAGVLLTMQLGSSSYGAGTSYLLPAFAVAFLGSTQIRPGRFNVIGTLVALYLLAIGVKGLQLQYPGSPWIKDMFEGVALVVAVGMGARSARRRVQRASALSS